jgi:hypothetical protein
MSSMSDGQNGSNCRSAATINLASSGVNSTAMGSDEPLVMLTSYIRRKATDDRPGHLVPAPTFWLLTVAYLMLLVTWPLAQAAARGRPGWALAIVFLSPLGGILWWIAGRRFAH